MKRKDSWTGHEKGLIVMVLAMVLFLLIAPKIMGGSYYWRIEPRFGGNTLDSGKVFLWTGADSTLYRALTLAGDSTAIDSVLDSVLISDTAVSRLVYTYYFFGQGAEDPGVEIVPPMSPRVSGGAVDSNRTEQGGAGSGTYIIDYFLYDTTDAAALGGPTPVPGWTVTAKPWNNLYGNPSNVAVTDENGMARFATDADSLAFVVPSGLYSFPTVYDSQTWVANDTFTLSGYLNVPAAAAGANYVTIYLDAVTGMVDSSTGAVIARDRLQFFLSLVGEPGLQSDSDHVIVPKTKKKRPTSTGRVSFTVMANTGLTPAGSYYSLYYKALDGSSNFSGYTRKFVVDTLTDPINILDCEEVP